MVTASVCGIKATLKVPWMSSTLATVRLIPSTAIEPFSTRNGRRTFGMSITTSRPAATPLIDLIVALDEMTVEQPACRQRQLQVDSGSDFQGTQVGAAKRFRDDVAKEDGRRPL